MKTGQGAYRTKAVYQKVVSRFQDPEDGLWYARLECGHLVQPFRHAKGHTCVVCSKKQR